MMRRLSARIIHEAISREVLMRLAQLRLNTLLFGSVFSAALLVSTISVQAAPARKESADEIMESLGLEATREAGADICYPATSEEYQALGKNGVLRIDASSAIATELPLKTAYLETKGLRIPLRLIVALDKVQNLTKTAKGTQYWHQVSFYLVPLNILKSKAELTVDFTGQRSGFGIMSLQADGPAFSRLDEYDTPSEPEPMALAALLAREYPADFPDRS